MNKNLGQEETKHDAPCAFARGAGCADEEDHILDSMYGVKYALFFISLDQAMRVRVNRVFLYEHWNLVFVM